MVEHIGKVMHATKYEKFENGRCPREYCMHEFPEEYRRKRY